MLQIRARSTARRLLLVGCGVLGVWSASVAVAYLFEIDHAGTYTIATGVLVVAINTALIVYARTRPAADDAQPEIAAYASLKVYREPGEVEPAPPDLVGRDALVARIEAALVRGERVLLHGFPGNGKTALASVIAARALAERTSGRASSVAWLSMEDASVESVFGQMLAAYPDPGRAAIGDPHAAVRAVWSAAREDGLRLLVLDDVHEDAGPVLAAVLDVVPVDLPVLGTSRVPFSIKDARLDERIEIESLEPADAISLLTAHAGAPLEGEAAKLSADLENHPLAMVIAGELLRQPGMSVRKLREELRSAPDRLGDLAGRRSLRALLDSSYKRLTEPERLVLDALGRFPGRGATAELLATYLAGDGQARAVDVELALTGLRSRSLAIRLEGSSYHGIHSLTYHYAETHRTGRPPHRDRVVRAIRAFVTTNDRGEVGDDPHIALLARDLRNIVGAAEWARGGVTTRNALVSIIGALAAHYVSRRGYAGLFNPIDENSCLFSTALSAADDAPAWRTQRHNLRSKRGNAYLEYGEHDKAIRDYTLALDLAPNPTRTVVLLSVIGNTYYEREAPVEAELAYSRAYAVAELTRDPLAMVRVLEQHSDTAFKILKDYELARRLARRGVDIAKASGQLPYAISLLINQGSAEFDMGVGESVALHEAEQKAAHAARDVLGEARAVAALGLDHHALNNFDAARQAFDAARVAFEACGAPEWARRVQTTMETFGYRERGADTATAEVALAELRSPRFAEAVATSLRLHEEALALAAEAAERDSGIVENLAHAHHAVALDRHALGDVRAAHEHLVAARKFFLKSGREPSARQMQDFMDHYGYENVRRHDEAQ